MAPALSLLLLIALRQAQWQLLGRQNREFVSFMQRYDRREFNPAHVCVPVGFWIGMATVALSQVTDQGLQRLYPRAPVQPLSWLQSSGLRDGRP